MTLEELKAALDAALEASNASPEDAALKAAAEAAATAYNEAKAADDAKKSKSDDGSEKLDESKWDERTKAYIARLRGESASHRTKNKELVSSVKAEKERVKAILKAAGIEDESEKPEEKVKTLTAESQTLAFRNAVLESAVRSGISGDDLEFFEFLVSKAAGALGEGEELSDDDLAEIVAKVKKGSKSSANTSVGGKGGGGTPPKKPGESGDVSLDDFCRMSITEKSQLYLKSPDLYTRLKDEAKGKKRLV